MKRILELDAERITNKADMSEYLSEFFVGDCENLDALNDVLSEVEDEVDVILTASSVKKICDNPYSYKVLLVLGRAAEENPNLHILFKGEQSE